MGPDLRRANQISLSSAGAETGGSTMRHRELKKHFGVLFTRMSPGAAAAMRSQGGSGAGLALSCCPTCRSRGWEAQLLRVTLLRRLHPACQCGRGSGQRGVGSGERGRSHLPRRKRSRDHQRAVAGPRPGAS